jgi:hypothetical protein
MGATGMNREFRRRAAKAIRNDSNAMTDLASIEIIRRCQLAMAEFGLRFEQAYDYLKQNPEYGASK